MESTHNVKPLLRARHISKKYRDLQAIEDVSLNIYSGQIHAIVGEHGAGKSTLAMVLSGYIQSDQGYISINNSRINPYSLKAAQRNGVRMVYQQSYLNEYFSVAENLFYNTSASTTYGIYSKRRVIERAKEYLEGNGFSIDPKAELRSLNLSDRVIVEIMKNLYITPRVLIFDETLEKLSQENYTKIFQLLMKLRSSGTAIISITHRIDDVYNFADSVTILKGGKLLVTDKVDNINKINLIEMAYTQVTVENNKVSPEAEFYQYFKYNEAILQHLPVDLIVIDEDLIIKMVNKHLLKSFKVEQEQFYDVALSEVLTGNKQALERIIKSIHESQSANFYSVELTICNITRKNNIKTFPVLDGSVVIGTIIIIEDVTEYDRLQKQLILSEKLASVGLLAAGVAHEINNPLEIISNYLSYISYRHTDPDIQESIGKVHQEIENIAKIVGNLVTFSDKDDMGFESFDLNSIIEDILELLKYNANLRHVDISFQAQHEQQLFWGDKGKIKQVILNLLKNSFEAMEGGGNVLLQTKDSSLKHKLSTRLIIEDNGTGISPENLDSVFMPFFSTKSGRNNKLGLGLSISYSIIESFGGEMSVVNRPQGGCRFVIDLMHPSSIPPRTAHIDM
jgi:two-component system sensor histidine kinase AtoS